MSVYFYMALLCAFIWEQTFANTLTIISPHRKSIQREFISKFKQYYQRKYSSSIDVQWIDQGGSENDLRFVQARYKKNHLSCGIDIFWGGGDLTFIELDDLKLLEPYILPTTLEKEIPTEMAGLRLRSVHNTWYASALSSFGIFYNKRVLNLLKLPEPKTWESLANEIYFNNISIADPRRSSSSLMMFLLMAYSDSWDKSWSMITKIVSNTVRFTHSSSDPIKAVVSGDAAMATAIDFYAQSKINALGKKNLGYVMPYEKTVLNSDPIAILKGAPNKEEAQKFIRFVLSEEGQSFIGS